MRIQEQPHEQLVDLSDGLLAQYTLAGDHDAFAVLVHRYTVPLHNYVLHIVRDDEQTHDIVQQVFLKLYQLLPTLHGKAPLKPWLFRVAHNCSIDELRRKKRHHEPLHFSILEAVEDEEELSAIEMIPDNSPLPEEVAERHDLHHRLHQALQTLPLKYRQIILLRYVGQRSFPEIGQALGIPASTAKTYLHRAKPFLRRALATQRLFTYVVERN